MNALSPVEDEAWEHFEQYFSLRHLKKGDILWRAGEVCKHVIFINKGALRCYYYTEEGKEVTGQFFFENIYLTDYYSFISKAPMGVTYEALEDTELIVIPRVGVYDLYDKYKSAERFGRLIAEHNFVKLLDEQITFKTLSIEDKYKLLVENRPEVMARVQLNLIASYLCISPEHLSRLRKRLMQEAWFKSSPDKMDLIQIK